MKKKGFVSLVGAGPGDTDLLTIKALRRLKEADLVIYDYLVNPEHLRHTSEHCRAICVGKGFRHKKMSQRRIQALILKEAKAGKKVVRLKGGDPYLFGRGGEEALFLHEHGVAFDVVPGITSATAVANYAGIPLTHREHNASVTFLTGHRATDDGLDSIDWKRIARMPGTLVIYMGFYNLAHIAKKLIGQGMSSTTPVAVIEWGTLPSQKKVIGPLGMIAQRVTKARLKPPCLIVVGDVVVLQSKLNWYEKLPLFGKTAWVLRMREKAGALSDLLRAQGAGVTELPLIRIEKNGNFRPLDREMSRIGLFQFLIFTSSHGVEAFFDRLSLLNKADARSLAHLKIVCVGPECARALVEHGLRADLVPERYESSAIPEAMRKRFGKMTGMRALLVRTQLATDDLERSLSRIGVRATGVTGYWTKTDTRGVRLLEKSADRVPDFVLFTSGSSVREFAKALGSSKARQLSQKSKFMSIGPMTSRALQQEGLRLAAQARRFDLQGLVDALMRVSRKGKR